MCGRMWVGSSLAGSARLQFGLEKFLGLRDRLVVFGHKIRVGFHLHQLVNLFARVFWTFVGDVSFRQVQAKEHVRLSELQTLLAFLQCKCRIAADYLRRFKVKLAENHVSASRLIAFVYTNDRIHLVAYVVNAGESRKGALFGFAAIVCAEPEMAFGLVVLQLHSRARGLYAFMKASVALALILRVRDKVIIEFRKTPCGFVVVLIVGSHLT